MLNELFRFEERIYRPQGLPQNRHQSITFSVNTTGELDSKGWLVLYVCPLAAALKFRFWRIGFNQARQTISKGYDFKELESTFPDVIDRVLASLNARLEDRKKMAG